MYKLVSVIFVCVMASLDYLETSSSWVVVVLFAGFVVFSFTLDFVETLVDRWVTRKRLWTVLYMLRRLKEEVLSVGLLAILLVLTEPRLLEICVPEHWVKGKGEQKSDPGVNPQDPHNRNLLAEDASKLCPSGSAHLFSKGTIHAVHVLIYIIVFLHVLYAFAFVLISHWRINNWRTWEQTGVRGVVLKADAWTMKSLGRNTGKHWLYVCVGHLVKPVDQVSYLSVRRLFLQTHRNELSLPEVDWTFDFDGFSKYVLGKSMAQLVSLNWALWIAAALVLALPNIDWQAYAMLAFSGISIVTLVVVAMKLHSVVIHLTAKAQYQFHDELWEDVNTPPAPPRPLHPPAPPSLAPTGVTIELEGMELEDIARRSIQYAESISYPEVEEGSRIPDAPPNVLPPPSEIIKQKSFVRRRVVDSVEDLFVGGSTGVLLTIHKVIYFGSAFITALVVSSMLGNEGRYIRALDSTTLWVLLVVQLALLLQNAWSFLPVYVLITMGRRDAGVVALKWKMEDKFLGYQEELSEKRGCKIHAGSVRYNIDDEDDRSSIGVIGGGRFAAEDGAGGEHAVEVEANKTARGILRAEVMDKIGTSVHVSPSTSTSDPIVGAGRDQTLHGEDGEDKKVPLSSPESGGK